MIRPRADHFAMNPTTRAILQTVMASDAALSEVERGLVQRLVTGSLGERVAFGVAEGERLLITQKRAAELLSVSRSTIWRMTKDFTLHPVEIFPGTWRYRFHEVARIADGRPVEAFSASKAGETAQVA